MSTSAKPPAKTLVFLANFPPIQSAIKRGQDGMRIQLDIPETEMVNAIGLMSMMNIVLKVTVEAVPIDVVGKDMTVDSLVEWADLRRESEGA